MHKYVKKKKKIKKLLFFFLFLICNNKVIHNIRNIHLIKFKIYKKKKK